MLSVKLLFLPFTTSSHPTPPRLVAKSALPAPAAAPPPPPSTAAAAIRPVAHYCIGL